MSVFVSDDVVARLHQTPFPARRKRRRSLSPHDRDRYDPRPRFDDGKGLGVPVTVCVFSSLSSIDFRGPGRARSPGGYPHRGGGSRFPDPYELDVPANFRAFADWFQATHPDDYQSDEALDGPRDSGGSLTNLRKRYEKYRKVMISKQVSVLY